MVCLKNHLKNPGHTMWLWVWLLFWVSACCFELIYSSADFAGEGEGNREWRGCQRKVLNTQSIHINSTTNVLDLDKSLGNMFFSIIKTRCILQKEKHHFSPNPEPPFWQNRGRQRLCASTSETGTKSKQKPTKKAFWKA